MACDSLIDGIAGGLVVSVLWAAGVLLFWTARRRWRYGRLKGDFEAVRKATGVVEWIVRIGVTGNRLMVAGASDSAPGFDGVILMSDELPGSGRGHYHRSTDPHAYGFLEVQVVDLDTILVHETYAHPEDLRAVVSGFVWNRI